MVSAGPILTYVGEALFALFGVFLIVGSMTRYTQSFSAPSSLPLAAVPTLKKVETSTGLSARKVQPSVV